MDRQQPTTTLLGITCRRCGAILAVSDGSSIVVFKATIRHQVTLTCECGATRSWKPDARALVVEEPTCYTDET